jgi:hypothetical protein
MSDSSAVTVNTLFHQQSQQGRLSHLVDPGWIVAPNGIEIDTPTPCWISTNDAQTLLPDRTSGGRERVVRTASNQSDRPNHQHQNDGQHHSIFSDILALFLRPELAKKFLHVRTSVPLSTILRLTRLDFEACDSQTSILIFLA